MQRAIIPRAVACAAVTVATDPIYAGLARQAELIAAGELSSRELTEACLERIARLDPTLNAFRVVFAERALIEADQADGRRRGGDERPLLGVPVAIKDDTDVAGEITAHGTNAYGEPAREDAEVVRRLRSAGAVIIGKTNVPELEIVPFTETPTFGATRNPWDLNRTPGGSSGGSAAAVAAGLVGGALASDGGGSIRIPAGCCGLFGLKPQRDRVPMAPLQEPWHGLSVYGAVTRHVADTALFLDATGDGEPLAPAVGRDPGKLRIGTSRRLAAAHRLAGRRAAGRARRHGRAAARARPRRRRCRDPATARPPSRSPPATSPASPPRRPSCPIPSACRAAPRASAASGSAIPTPPCKRARAEEAANARAIATVFEHADVLMTPMFTKRPIPIGTYEGRGALWSFNGYSRWVPYCAPFNHTGQPAASVPAGFTDDGFPLAVQLVARPGDEATLVSLAAQIEAARPWADRVPPL